MTGVNCTGTQTVLITGAAIRIGREIALSLADCGWDIAVHYNTSEEHAEELAAMIKNKGRKAFLVQADLRNPQEVAQVIPAVTKHGVTIDCLINNASLFEKDSLADITPESWRSHMDVNLFAPMQLIRDFAAQYKGDAGNIINLTDGLTGWSLSPAFLSYSISKFGLSEITRLLVTELAPCIRINAIALGPTTPGKQDNPDTFEKLRKFIPLGRTSSTEEVCNTVDYILSSPSLTGQVISLSGGV